MLNKNRYLAGDIALKIITILAVVILAGCGDQDSEYYKEIKTKAESKNVIHDVSEIDIGDHTFIEFSPESSPQIQCIAIIDYKWATSQCWKKELVND